MQSSNPNSVAFPRIIPNMQKVLAAARSNQKPIFYGQHTMLPAEHQTKYGQWLAKGRGTAGHFVENTPGWEIVKEIAPQKDDFVIKKFTPNFFLGTYLEQILRNKEIETIIFIGAATEHGIDTTARHASFLGFMPVIVEDAIGSKEPVLHEAAMKIMREAYMFEFKKTDYIVEKLSEK